jgi:site-specific DNA recombinase
MVTSATVAGHRVYRGQIVAHGNWAPILDEQTWQACRLRLSQPRRVNRSDGKGSYPIGEKHHGRSTGRKYLPTGGLVVCGVCDCPVSGTSRKVGNKENVPYLTCHPKYGGKGCAGILLAKTDKYVIETLFSQLDNPDFLNAVAADEHKSRRDVISTQLDAIDKQRRELAALWATPGELTVAEWQEARQGLAENERVLRKELSELPSPVVNVDIKGARAAWPDMTLDEQREFLRLFIRKVTIHRVRPGAPRVFDTDRIDIEWR